MDALVPMMIQDPVLSGFEQLDRLTEGFWVRNEEFFLDGPVCRRVAVVDLDPRTGALAPGARYLPPEGDRINGKYDVAADIDVFEPTFIQVSTFATVMRTMKMYERADTLGRRLHWAFDGPQLLVVPRAGEWANAFYERDSRSLQLFFFDTDDQIVYTALSRDIVSHETGHAILDGIAPDLYGALTPQALGLHEGIADLTALLVSLDSKNLVDAVLRATDGSIEDSTAFSSIAEQFGRALRPEGHDTSLRSLLNQRTLDPNDTTVDLAGRPNRVSRAEPHALSEVLTGALYAVLVRLHEQLSEQFRATSETPLAASGKALGVGGARFRRLILRALDYLPPGEVSFVDYGRAIVAADQASHPDEAQERGWLVDQFVHRCMADSANDLEVRTDYEESALNDLDLETLIESDWAAYEFANHNRELLGIPDAVPFRVLPRLDATKTYYPGNAPPEGLQVRELIFKVSWDQHEPNPLGPGFPADRRVAGGTSLAIDWKTHRVRSCLTSDAGEQQREDRTAFLRQLSGSGVLRMGPDAVGPDEHPLRGVVQGLAMGDVMRVRATGRLLHLISADR